MELIDFAQTQFLVSITIIISDDLLPLSLLHEVI